MTIAGIILVSAGIAVWAVGAVWVAVIDFRTKLLPKKIIWPTGLAVLGLYVVAAIVETEPSRILAAVLAGASCGAIFSIIYYLYPEGMGFGDVRLVTMNGLAVGWFGISAAWVSLVLGFVLAFPLSVWFLIRHGVSKGLKVESPFGPFLVAGAGLAMVLEALGVTDLP